MAKQSDVAWDRLAPEQSFLPSPFRLSFAPACEVSEPVHEQAPGTVRFVCISDTHSLHSDIPIPAGDVLIHAGDFSDTGVLRQVEGFSEFLAQQPHKHKIVIAGNHDASLHPTSYLTGFAPNWKRFHHREPYDYATVRAALERSCHYLEDSSVVVEGYRIYGSPWQPRFCSWAFNLPRGQPLQQKWAQIPDDTDILVTHGPPLGRGDLCSDGHRVGCEDLLLEVQRRVRPALHVFGHIHEGYGVSSDGTTTFVNASSCTQSYEPHNSPVVIDLPVRPEHS